MSEHAETTTTESIPDSYEQYAAGHENARFTAWLRDRTEQQWTDATTHRFTRELGADDLDDAVFRRYLLQDYAFLDDLVSTFGYAVGQAPTMDARARLVDFLGTLTSDENDYFERSFEALDVHESEYHDPKRTETTRAFADLLGRASRQGGYAETLAVLTPAEWIYREWASAVADQSPDRFYLAEWIDLHHGPAFEGFVDFLRDELDREGAAISDRRQHRLADIFARTVELEVAFFDAPYEPRGDS